VIRRWWPALALAASGGLVALLLVALSNRDAASTTATVAEAGVTQMRLAAHEMSRPLDAPISGEAAVTVGDRVWVIGGLDSANASTDGVFALDPRSGALRPIGMLPQPLHDEAAAASGHSVLVLGGGSATSTDGVESLSPGGSASAVGRLPGPRSDLVAATVGGRTYVLGGYDGTTPNASVLSTTDGRTFKTVARLPVPVRYPAAAVAGNSIYLFGGETASGRPTDAVQQVDPAAGTARIAAHLPSALDHAAAVALGGQIYVLGGTAGSGTTDRIVSFDPGTRAVRAAGALPGPVSNAAAVTVGGSGYLIGGLGRGGAPLDSIIRITAKAAPAPSQPPTTSTDSTTSTTSTAAASRRGSLPFTGRMLIADRGNNRLLVVNARKRVLWRYPGPGRPAPPGGFYFPDDAFFTRGGTGIISNEEENERIVQLAFPSGRVTWSYGHAGVIGSSPGYLHEPDDAYLLKNGTVTVADAQNCRILLIGRDGHTRQIGQAGVCVHNPPQTLASPNGDTPLANGDLLVSEVNGSYIDELTPRGHLVWSTHLPIAYPSDPQQLGPNRYLVADYTRPGGIFEFTRSGRIVWSYRPRSGPRMLDHPSLAERLPNGLIAANDDYRDRVVVIDPRTKRIVWQYGRTDSPGTGADRLKVPDGFDLLTHGGVTPTHPYTG
jgi:Kelch motif protein/putative pyrroloquinoline-quinone binding quinoprotein